MSTTHFSDFGGVCLTPPPHRQTPLEADPQMQSPSQMQTTQMQAPVGRLPSPTWTEWLTDASKNITFPQTSFVGGNK